MMAVSSSVPAIFNQNHAACSVPGCSNNGIKCPELSFHSFPGDKIKIQAWIHAIRRDPGPTFQIKRGSTFVCSAHFIKSDYKWTPVRKTLLSTAVPTVFNNCEGWEKLKDGRYRFIRKQPMDRSAQSVTEPDLEDNATDLLTDPCCAESTDCMYDEAVTCRLESRIQQLELTLADKDKELDEKKLIINRLTCELHMEKWGVHRFTTEDDKIKFYTGFISYDLFRVFYESIKPTAENMTSAYYLKVGDKRSLAGRPRTMLLIDELFMSLMRIRLNSPEKDLADRFHISEATVSRKVLTWVTLLYQIRGSLPIWLPKDQIQKSMPPCFSSTFPTTRVIIDCTEIPTQYASSLVLNSQLYSNYKSRTTLKCLLGVAPNGAFTFISPLFCGSMSDVAITKLSGILDLLEPGDMVMADKGFKISKLLEGRNIDLNLPPFLSNMRQFTPEEVQQTEEIASSRIHVERAIGRVKEYSIFDKVPLSMIGSINQIWVVACILSNFQLPLIRIRE